MTTRAEWQQLAEDRILDAQAHLAPGVGRWSAAFYLVGYAVECGLKACILARVAARPEVIFEDRQFLNKVWTHDIETLLVAADLKGQRDADARANPALAVPWDDVDEWDEKSRYVQKTEAEAKELFNAVADPINGVMQWIRARW